MRQLENVVVSATIRASGQGLAQIQSSHLFRDSADGANGREPEPPEPTSEHGTFQEETRHFQKALLARALKAADWNVATAARRLDITRGHVYALIKAFGLSRDGRTARLSEKSDVPMGSDTERPNHGRSNG